VYLLNESYNLLVCICRRDYDDPYRAPIEERPAFKPAETIDYGHKPTGADRGKIKYALYHSKRQRRSPERKHRCQRA